MFDFLLDCIVVLLPSWVFWSLFSIFIVGCALLYWWR